MPKKIQRRTWLKIFFYGTALGAVGYVYAGEVHRLRIRRISLPHVMPCRVAHITDIHYKGERAYLERVVEEVNAQKPDLVCFTGDLMENTKWLPEALELIASLQAPVYGVPGNHEYWSHAPVADLETGFSSTGGGWLARRSLSIPQYDLTLVGADEMRLPGNIPTNGFRILLTHYPAHVDRMHGAQFDLILAGHSHGGQVRIPFYGAPVLPGQVGPYDRGRFNMPAGTLYVNPGIGTYFVNVRIACRPEITLFDLG